MHRAEVEQHAGTKCSMRLKTVFAKVIIIISSIVCINNTDALLCR